MSFSTTSPDIGMGEKLTSVLFNHCYFEGFFCRSQPNRSQKKNLLNSFYEANIILTPKTDKDSTRKDNYRPILFINIDSQLLGKISANLDQQ